MPTLVPSFLELLQPFQSQMTSPTFASLLTVLAGWVLSHRRHTVTGRWTPWGGRCGKHFCAYHRLFAAARWDVEQVGLALAGLILRAFAGGGRGGGDGVPRRRRHAVPADAAARLFGAGMHYDAQLTGRRWSNANRSVKSRGHCWVILGVVITFPFRPGHCYCLPVLSRLYLNNKAAARHRRAYRTKPQLALEMLGKLCGRVPAAAASTCWPTAPTAGRNLLGELPANCALTCRWILNAALYAPAPPRRRARRAAAACAATALPGVAEMLAGALRRT